MIPNEICRPGEIGGGQADNRIVSFSCPTLWCHYSIFWTLWKLNRLQLDTRSKASDSLSTDLTLSRARIIGHNWQMNEKRVQRGPSHQCTATTNKRRRPNAINRRGWRGGIDWPAGRLASDWFGCSDGRQVSDHWRLISTRLSGSAPRRQRQK